jgi:hypothetical protein
MRFSSIYDINKRDYFLRTSLQVSYFVLITLSKKKSQWRDKRWLERASQMGEKPPTGWIALLSYMRLCV